MSIPTAASEELFIAESIDPEEAAGRRLNATGADLELETTAALYLHPGALVDVYMVEVIEEVYEA